jgi:hypothetical protein
LLTETLKIAYIHTSYLATRYYMGNCERIASKEYFKVLADRQIHTSYPVPGITWTTGKEMLLRNTSRCQLTGGSIISGHKVPPGLLEKN